MGQEDRYRNTTRRRTLAPGGAPVVIAPVYASRPTNLAGLAANVLGVTPSASLSGAGPTQSPQKVVIQGRRFLPLAESMPAADTYVVTSSDRLDLLAAKLLGDPLLYWQLADANDAMDVNALCQPGAVLRVPAPTSGLASVWAAGVLPTDSDATDDGSS